MGYHDFNGYFSSARGHAPCEKDCSERSITCHGTCEKYISWKKDHDKRKEEIAKAKMMRGNLDDMEKKRYTKKD